MGGFHLNLIQNLPPVCESPLLSSLPFAQCLARAKSREGASVSSKGTAPPTPDDRIMRTNGLRYPLRRPTVTRRDTHAEQPPLPPPAAAPTTTRRPCHPPPPLPPATAPPPRRRPVAAPQVNVSVG